jgi:hypothetical protein
VIPPCWLHDRHNNRHCNIGFEWTARASSFAEKAGSTPHSKTTRVDSCGLPTQTAWPSSGGFSPLPDLQYRARPNSS